jgi:acyl-CoA synthetase (AMP-forming)/AMP-acid ligase II
MGRMMDEPLMISSIIRFAARHDGSSEIVARRVEGDVHRYTVRDCEARARRLANVLRDGWFPTGDVATIDADGFMQITDRSKDVIKSGGERIGSIDLENIALAHPAVLQAACIAMRHPKWDERPLPVVVRRPEAAITREEPLRFFEGKVARFWMPDDVVFVETLPTGATGKVQKNRLREQFGDYLQRDVPG